MVESKFLALVRDKKSLHLFRLALPDGPCNTVELAEGLEKEGLTLIDVGTPQQLNKIESDFRIVDSVQKS